MVAGAFAEDNGVQQGVRAQPVAAVNADAGAFAGGVNARYVGQAVHVGLDAAHHVVHAGAYRDRVADHVHPGQVDADLPYLAELLHDQRLTEVAAVQHDTTVHPVARVDLGLLGAGDDVPRGQLHHVGGVSGHKTVSVFVQQVGPLAPGRLGNQYPAPGQGGRVILDHLHVHELSAGVVGQRHAVAGHDKGVGAGLEHSSEAAGAENDGLRPDGVYLTGTYLQGHDAADLAVFDDQGSDEPLFVTPHSRLDELFEHHVEHGLTGEVADEECSGAALAAEGAGPQVALVVPVEGDAEVLHVDQCPARGLAHDLYRILIAQEVAALHRVVGVVFPVIAAVGQRGVDAALGRVGVTSHRMYLADDGRVGPVRPRGYRRPHAGQTGSDYQDIMLQHVCLTPPGDAFV